MDFLKSSGISLCNRLSIKTCELMWGWVKTYHRHLSPYFGAHFDDLNVFSEHQITEHQIIIKYLQYDFILMFTEQHLEQSIRSMKVMMIILIITFIDFLIKHSPLAFKKSPTICRFHRGTITWPWAPVRRKLARRS